MGKVTLDFDGPWTSTSKVAVKMAMGELTLRLPRRVGVRLTLDRFLASFDPAGLVRTGDAFESPGYARRRAPPGHRRDYRRGRRAGRVGEPAEARGVAV